MSFTDPLYGQGTYGTGFFTANVWSPKVFSTTGYGEGIYGVGLYSVDNSPWTRNPAAPLNTPSVWMEIA